MTYTPKRVTMLSSRTKIASLGFFGHCLESRWSPGIAADLPRKLLLLTFAGFVNRDQARLIANLLPFSWFAMPANCNR
ncbi:MAG TPA: hypothetical protein EYP98_02950 [Planctomycetes bacterium]|nr:hypothetical protein [Planctomycetota bacterium]